MPFTRRLTWASTTLAVVSPRILVSISSFFFVFVMHPCFTIWPSLHDEHPFFFLIEEEIEFTFYNGSYLAQLWNMDLLHSISSNSYSNSSLYRCNLYSLPKTLDLHMAATTASHLELVTHRRAWRLYRPKCDDVWYPFVFSHCFVALPY